MPTNTQGVLRVRPRINVTRGYAGNEPSSITRSEPLDSATIDHSDQLGATIYSGQPIVLDSGVWKQVAHVDGILNGAAGSYSKPQSIHFAYHDSADTDVDSCGKLLGFSALGKFEIESAWVDLAGVSVGSQLGVKVVNGQGILAVCDWTSAAVHTTTPCVGIVTEIRDLGVGGHTALNYSNGSGNPRGGVASSSSGSIPEDSTANPYADGTGNTAHKIVKFVTQI